MLYSDLTWPTIKRKLKKSKVLLPLGSLEQHGYHLPLATDALIAEKLAHIIGKKTNFLVLPTIHYSISPEHSAFPGTIVISEKTLVTYLKQIYFSIEKFGLKKLIILNAHGGNHAALGKLSRGFKIINVWRLLPHTYFEHAGEFETSLALVLMPEKVRMNRLTRGAFTKAKSKNIRIEKYSKSGVMGDATKASKEKGKKILSVLIDKITKLI